MQQLSANLKVNCSNLVGSGNSVTLRVHRGPTSSARNRSCNCSKPGGNSLVVKHVLVQQQSFNGIDGAPEESTSGDKRAKTKSLPNCPNCNASTLDPNNSNSNLLAFSSKLAKFKREKKAAKNLAIVVGKIHLNLSELFLLLIDTLHRIHTQRKSH